ncbi:MAG: AlwI family type II restriction endonuclease [Treponematales bacterium]
MRLWSITTTVRNPERIRSFLQVFKELEGQVWNGETQKRFQILLIQRKVYGFNEPQFEKTLSPEQMGALYLDNFTYEQAANILESKNYEGGGEMRGRQSYNPLEKMGLAYLDADDKIHITDFGRLFLADDYDLGDVFFRSFLKWQYPNPDANKYSAADGYNVKPLIATFHLINKVNTLCAKNGVKEKGVSRVEFALFFTTLSNYHSISETAEKLLAFRKEYERKSTKEAQKNYAEKYFNDNFSAYESWKNANEYTDNLIRYFRLTRFFYLRGNDYFIDLEPRRRVEIDALLETDNASALTFTSRLEYAAYLGDIAKPELPWETKAKLQEVIAVLLQDIETAENSLLEKHIARPQRPQIDTASNNTDALKNAIELLREYRRTLFDAETHAQGQELQTIEYCVQSLQNIFSLADKKPVELERIVTLGLHILNDAIGIRPNYPVGDDNEPTFTAPANKPDIECYYQSFNSICEVTLLSNRSQWFNEGQPVMRHLRDFESAHTGKQTYCLFVAPKIHRDTGNTFWVSVKYEYEGQSQKIIPVTIQQFTEILSFLLAARKQKGNYHLPHGKIQELFDIIVSETAHQTSAPDWLATIPAIIKTWGRSLAA